MRIKTIIPRAPRITSEPAIEQNEVNFVNRNFIQNYFRGKSVAIVCSGPSCDQNEKGFIDSHDIVMRVNNYKLTERTGRRTDVIYSFFGSSIRKTQAELAIDGVNLCMAKCPDDALPVDQSWHRRNGKLNGVSFKWIYESRAKWWFCDTYIPPLDDFMRTFMMLDYHIPTTGFSALREVLQSGPRSVHLTGFDGFTSGIHNLNEPWREKNKDQGNEDPYGHSPNLELKLVGQFCKELKILKWDGASSIT